MALTTKKSLLTLLTLLLLAAGLASNASPASAEPIQDVSNLAIAPDRIWDVDDRSGLARHTGEYRTLVWNLHQMNGVMYVGGDFTTLVAPDGTRHSRSFLAAFDLETGEWIQNFDPQLDSVVYSIDSTSDGKLVVGGEFDGGVALLDPASGARVAGFDADLEHSWGPAAVFTVETSGNVIYAGGRFAQAQGTSVDNLARLDATTGQLDATWMPTVEAVSYGGKLSERVRDIEVDVQRGRVYVGGLFGSINGDAETDSFAILSPVDGSTLMDHPNVEYDTNRPIIFLYDITLDGDLVHYGGKENFTITVNADTFERVGDVAYTNNGDHQVIHSGDKTLWIGCHCWRQAFATTPPNNPFAPTPDAVDVNAVFAIDKATGEVQPIVFDLVGSAGAWDIEEDNNGRLWVAGQFTQGGGRKLTGLARFSPQSGNQSALTSCNATRNGAEVEVEWEGDAAPDSFVVRRSVDGGSNNWRGRTAGDVSGFTDTDRPGDLSYSVEAKVGQQIIAGPLECSMLTEEPALALTSCSVTRDRAAVNVAWESELAPDTFVIRRSVDRGTTFWRGRTAGDGTSFEDSDRAGDLSYTVEAKNGSTVVAGPLICA